MTASILVSSISWYDISTVFVFLILFYTWIGIISLLIYLFISTYYSNSVISFLSILSDSWIYSSSRILFNSKLNFTTLTLLAIPTSKYLKSSILPMGLPSRFNSWIYWFLDIRLEISSILWIWLWERSRIFKVLISDIDWTNSFVWT